MPVQNIAVLIEKTPLPEAADIVWKMTAAAFRDDFCVQRVHSEHGLGIHVGWTGLKDSGMPLWNHSRDTCVFFVGSDYPSHNNSPQLYDDSGIEFINGLNGYFNGLLLNLRLREALLFNDRYGLRRLYWHETPNALYIASQAKSLLAVLPHLRQLDIQGLGELLACGCVLQNRTLFPGVSLLPGGSLWRFSSARQIQRDYYFKPEDWEEQEPFDREAYCAQLQDAFPRVLEKYLQTNTRIAMSLTGGIDGRMVMAWANRGVGELPCYTFGGPQRDCEDVRIARAVAAACRQPHQTIRIAKDFFAEFRELAEKAILISDGCMDVSGAVELYVNRLARQIAPYRLTGNYGSETLRGNVAFKPSSVNALVFQPEVVASVNSCMRTYAQEMRCHPLTFIAFKQVPWHHYSRWSIEESQLQVRTPFLDNELVSLAYRMPSELRTSKEPCLRLVAKGNPTLSCIPTDRGVLYRPIPLLTKIRSMTKDITFKAEYVYDYGMPQPVAAINYYLRPLKLERLFLGRHKFYHFRTWYQGPLKETVKDLLLDRTALLRPYINAPAVKKLLEDHFRGFRNHTTEIHQLVALQLIHQTLLCQN